MNAVMQDNSAQNRFAFARALAAFLLVVAAIVPFVNSTFSLFKVQNAHANTIEAGTVVVTNSNSATSASLPGTSSIKPGDEMNECINVSYAGSLPALIKIYHNSTNSSLERYVRLTITRGTLSAPNNTSCDSFTSASNTPIYSGTLQDLPDDYTNGISDQSQPVWNPGNVTPNVHAYKLTMSIDDANEAQGLNMQNTITWEARNI